MKSEASLHQRSQDKTQKQVNLRMYLAEFLGTAILLSVGLSIVIFMFGENAPGSHLIPHYKLRQAITGFLFGSVGASIALSPLGKISGAHVNPVVTMGFRLMGKMTVATTVGYILAQLAGAAVGCLPLLVWGSLGKSIYFGGTTRGAGYTVLQCLMGEVITTFTLVAMLCFFIANRKLRQFTPFMIPVLYCIMVPLEADVSGISTNPARSFGPAVISGQWTEWWIYWVGPIGGMLLAIILASLFALKIEEAKLYHFESDNRRFGKLRAVKQTSTKSPETI
jgi:aquaporin Z